jgi:hypothetical protein
MQATTHAASKQTMAGTAMQPIEMPMNTTTNNETATTTK